MRRKFFIIVFLLLTALVCQTNANASDLRLIGMGYMHKIVSDDIDYQFNVSNILNSKNNKYLGKYDISLVDSKYFRNSSASSYESSSKTTNINLENTLILPLGSSFTVGLLYNPTSYQYGNASKSEDFEFENSSENGSDSKEDTQKIGVMAGFKIIPQLRFGLGINLFKSNENSFSYSGSLASPESDSLVRSSEKIFGLSFDFANAIAGLQYKSKIEQSQENQYSTYSSSTTSTTHPNDLSTETSLDLKYGLSTAIQIKGFVSLSESDTSYYYGEYDNSSTIYTTKSVQKEYLLGAEQKLNDNNIFAYAIGLTNTGLDRTRISETSGNYEYSENGQVLSLRLGTELGLFNNENLLARFGIIQTYSNNNTKGTYKNNNGAVTSVNSDSNSSWNTAYTTGLGYKFNNAMFDIVFTSSLLPMKLNGNTEREESNSYSDEENTSNTNYSHSSRNQILFCVTLDL